MPINDIFLDSLPSIDLHGFDKESARVMTSDFVLEAQRLGYEKIVIIHGIGSGIVKNSVHETLKKNKHVLSYKLHAINIGCTIVEIKNDQYQENKVTK